MRDAREVHPSPACLAAFDRGQLSSIEWNEIEAHLMSCEECCLQLEHVPEDALLQSLKVAVAAPTPALLPNVPRELVGHGRYHVLEFLGGGGMGLVFKAKHRLMERTVALKIMRKDLLGRTELVDRFRQEVKAAARLSHGNIVTAHDAEQVGDLHFLVMEYVEGMNLEQLVTTFGPRSVEQACFLVQQAALGLQHAFERGMTHRDVKPSNLLLSSNNRVKVLDFGLARLIDAGDFRTPTGVVVGTPDYLAPEQAQDGRHAGTRSDIYSLGCVLYFLLTGRPPYAGATVLEKLMAHQTQPPPALEEQRPDVPAALAALISRMLAKSPDDRPQTPAEVAETLGRYASASTGLTPFLTNASPSMARLPTCVPSPPIRADFRRSRRVFVVGGILVLGGALAVLIWSRHQDTPPVLASATNSSSMPESHATDPARPRLAPLSRKEMRDQALAWLVKHNTVKPPTRFLENMTAQLDDRFQRKVGFKYELGTGLVDSHRPTILLARCGAFHVFELSDSQARNWTREPRHVIDADVADQDELDPAPAIELSDLDINNALRLDGEQQITGSVRVHCVTAQKGPLSLRLVSPSDGVLNLRYQQLPDGLPAGRISCPFAFGRLNNKDGGRRVGPCVVCLEVYATKKNQEKAIVRVLSNSVAMVVNLDPPAQP
jgi:serine/threonine protein kinase